MVALDWRGKLRLRRMALDCGGDRAGRRRGRRTLPDDCWLRGNHGGGLGLPECSEEHGASFYSATGLAPRWWIRSTTSRRRCSCRASWRRRARADEHEDKHGLFPGAAGARGWLGRRRPRQSPLPTPACRQGSHDGGAVGRQGVLDGSGEWASAWRGSAGEQGPGCDAATRAHARAKRTLWPRPEHAHQVFDEMPPRARELG